MGLPTRCRVTRCGGRFRDLLNREILASLLYWSYDTVVQRWLSV